MDKTMQDLDLEYDFCCGCRHSQFCTGDVQCLRSEDGEIDRDPRNDWIRQRELAKFAKSVLEVLGTNWGACGCDTCRLLEIRQIEDAYNARIRDLDRPRE